MLGRISTLVEIRKRGCSSVIAECKFCKICEESVDHLLCHCPFVWGIWHRWLSLWNVQVVVPNKLVDFFKVWLLSKPRRVQTWIWKLSFFSFSWSIWLARNETVFSNSKFSADYIFNLGVLRLGWWCKALAPENVGDLNVVLNDPIRFQDICGFKAKGFGNAGIGGVMRNERGETIISFSKNVGRLDATSTEILAVLEAMKIIKTNR
ncbi:hypothetical protein HRI_001520900 [Hibiscus trionum]|uniref:Reverse transcriptase zinc-binding domain-containing protein n=1 Tax=Hibiscus trionum TaxID=183268 RepID=A0A9W7LWG1_HIBTR|nr:hypothetical protein HRI_001520900 [Hibiscus trionum]